MNRKPTSRSRLPAVEGWPTVSHRLQRWPACKRLPAAPQVTELPSGAPRAEEDDFLLFIFIRINEVRLPAASFGISTSPAFDTDKLSRSHEPDDAATRRGRTVAKEGRSVFDRSEAATQRSETETRCSCEHMFVTSQGSASGRFQRACEHGQVQQAEMAAREMGRLSLMHALSLVVLYARAGSPKFEPAAVRWLARARARWTRGATQRDPARRRRTRMLARPEIRAGREDAAPTALTTARRVTRFHERRRKVVPLVRA
jgi:hypothetical protein